MRVIMMCNNCTLHSLEAIWHWRQSVEVLKQMAIALHSIHIIYVRMNVCSAAVRWQKLLTSCHTAYEIQFDYLSYGSDAKQSLWQFAGFYKIDDNRFFSATSNIPRVICCRNSDHWPVALPKYTCIAWITVSFNDFHIPEFQCISIHILSMVSVISGDKMHWIRMESLWFNANLNMEICHVEFEFHYHELVTHYRKRHTTLWAPARSLYNDNLRIVSADSALEVSMRHIVKRSYFRTCSLFALSHGMNFALLNEEQEEHTFIPMKIDICAQLSMLQ